VAEKGELIREKELYEKREGVEVVVCVTAQH